MSRVEGEDGDEFAFVLREADGGGPAGLLGMGGRGDPTEKGGIGFAVVLRWGALVIVALSSRAVQPQRPARTRVGRV
jgi:hypothetical protein